jgi:hypothetical protein
LTPTAAYRAVSGLSGRVIAGLVIEVVAIVVLIISDLAVSRGRIANAPM